MTVKLIKAEEEKEQSQTNYEVKLNILKEKIDKNTETSSSEVTKLVEELKNVHNKLEGTERQLEIKVNEYELLRENVYHLEGIFKL